MLKLSNKTFLAVSRSLKDNARKLEKYLYEYYFEQGSSEKVAEELKKYQNDDGGFGHALEPDFRLPYSSPMATSIGLRYLSELDNVKNAPEMVKAAINYLETTFDNNRNGWFALSEAVNNYPHAPWWHYDEQKGMTVIDFHWGNPSAEILSYLYKYRELVTALDIDSLIAYAVQYIEEKEEFDSEFELFCYIKLFEAVPEEKQKMLKDSIKAAVAQVIEYDPAKWGEYVPLPLDFVPAPDKESFGVQSKKIEENLDYYIQLIESGKGELIKPPWGESFYQDGLKPAYQEWLGIITLEVLKRLDNYDRLDK